MKYTGMTSVTEGVTEEVTEGVTKGQEVFTYLRRPVLTFTTSQSSVGLDQTKSEKTDWSTWIGISIVVQTFRSIEKA